MSRTTWNGCRRTRNEREPERMTKVQCRCGAVEIEISRPSRSSQFFCHCDDCQAVHGGAYTPESVYPADAVKVVARRSDGLETQAQSPLHLPRMRHAPVHRCPGRGSAGRQRIPAPAGEFRPAFHVQCQFAVTADRRRPAALQGHAGAVSAAQTKGWVGSAVGRLSFASGTGETGLGPSGLKRAGRAARTYIRSARRSGSGPG